MREEEQVSVRTVSEWGERRESMIAGSSGSVDGSYPLHCLQERHSRACSPIGRAKARAF